MAYFGTKSNEPILINGTTAVVHNNKIFSIRQASASSNGYLSSVDWTTFNDKEPAISTGTTAQYWRGDKSWQALIIPQATMDTATAITIITQFNTLLAKLQTAGIIT